MKSVLSKIVAFCDGLSEWTGRIMSWVLILIIGIVLYEVIVRYIFSKPTVWAVESSTMLHGVLLLFGGVYALVKKAHVNMDLFYAKWSPRTQAIVNVITFPLVFILFMVMLWQLTAYGIESLKILEHSRTPWRPPVYHHKIVLSLAVLLILLQGLADFIRNLTLAVTGEELP